MMRRGARHLCRLHRPALVAFVDRREIGGGTAAALDHLDRCGHCARELEQTALAIAALRRWGAEASRVAPSDDGWPIVRQRAMAPRAPAWRWRTPLGAMLVASWLMGALVGPSALRPGRGMFEETWGGDVPAASYAPGQRAADAQSEAAYIRPRRPPTVVILGSAGVAPRIDPDRRRDLGDSSPTRPQSVVPRRAD
jgi:hypothetical protein